MRFEEDSKLSNERSKYRRICYCGHSIVVTPTGKGEWITCSWCGQKVYRDKEKQKEQEKIIKRENFRLKMWRML